MAVDAGTGQRVRRRQERFEHVQKLSSSGDPLGQWGSQGADPGQFSLPGGITVDGQGDILVTDAGNGRVQRFGPDGKVRAFWGTFGDGPARWNRHQVLPRISRATSTWSIHRLIEF